VRFIFIVTSLFITTLAYGNTNHDDNYVVNYGILEQGGNGLYYVKTQTTDIPYITESQDSDFKFGYTVKESTKGFLLHTRLTLPITDHTYVNRAHEIVANNDLKTKTVTTQNKYYLNEPHELVMSLEDGDPPGVYKMELFINDSLYKTITFDIRKQ
jgi:hypothetical protein